MYEIPMPQSALERQKITNKYKRICTLCTVFFYLCAAIAVLSLIGVLVTVIVFEFRYETAGALFYALTGSLAGGAVIGALLAFAFSKLLARADETRLDFAERLDGENSFFVGDGTLATFGEVLTIHGEVKGKGKIIKVPYSEIRFFSVCTRRAPKEKGEWSVVLEIPARYLSEKGREKSAPPILIQAYAKERLYRVIEAHGLTLLGEKREERENKQFTLQSKYLYPEREKRRRSLIFALLGSAVAVVGIPVAILWHVMLGSILTVFGLFFAVRSFIGFANAKGVLALYEEGIWWKDTGTDRVFLKWEEIENITRTEEDGKRVLKVECAYGAYHFPEIADIYDDISAKHPEKVKN